jgi:hypothetical protein
MCRLRPKCISSDLRERRVSLPLDSLPCLHSVRSVAREPFAGPHVRSIDGGWPCLAVQLAAATWRSQAAREHVAVEGLFSPGKKARRARGRL